MISTPNIYAEAKGLSTIIFDFMDNTNLGMKEKKVAPNIEFFAFCDYII